MATGCLLDNLTSSPIHPGNRCIYSCYTTIWYSCSMMFFQFKKHIAWAGLGRILERCLYNHTKNTGVQCLPLPVSARGSSLKPFPRVLHCPRNIPKLRSCMGLVVVWIWASLIIDLAFFGNMGVACWVWASDRSANFATCPATRCYKKSERKPSW